MVRSTGNLSSMINLEMSSSLVIDTDIYIILL